MLLQLAVTPVLEKVRYHVPFDGLVWHVDVYDGGADGLVVAEIELESEDQVFARPDWVGREVTHEPCYRNSFIARTAAVSRLRRCFSPEAAPQA